MKTFNKTLNILILSENNDVLDYYSKLMSKNFKSHLFHTSLVDSIDTDLEAFDLILIDINKTNVLKELHKKLKLLQNTSLVLIVPLSRALLQEYIDQTDKYTLILKKPIIIKNLIGKLEDCFNEINEKSFIMDKNNILIDIINKNPNMLCVFDQNEKLFFANNSFLDYFSLGIEKETNFDFNKFFNHEVNYTEIVLNLKQKKLN